MNDNIFGRDGFYWWIGVVEDREDPEKLGRCRVRILGYHLDNKDVLPTGDLPWAIPMQSITSAGISGKGSAPVGPLEGSWVVGFFLDGRDKQQPMIMGTMGGLPDKSRACGAQESNQTQSDTGVLRDGSGNIVKDGSGDPVRTDQSGSTTATPLPKNQKIQENLEKVVLACKRQGITDHKFVAAILGNVLKECGGITKSEYGYGGTKAPRLREVFGSRVSRFGDVELEALARDNIAFYDCIYGIDCSNPDLPKNFDHTQRGDGFKYRGRGFIQFTGKSLYRRLSKLAYNDERFVSNPDLLNDPENAAAATAAFIQLSINSGVASRLTGISYPGSSQNDANILVTSMVAGGGDIRKKGSIGAEILNKVNGFAANFTIGVSPGGVRVAELLGQPVSRPPDQAGPNTAQPNPQTTAPTEVLNDPKLGSPEAFKDPNSVYPSCEYTDRPDTNKLATGDTTGTIVENKERNRVTEVSTANGGNWSEPKPAFCGKYPYNHVVESESGHVIEMDDTPAHQRLHMYHRTGTFVEIDENGTYHQHVQGDHYGIYVRNNHVYIKGGYDITVDNAAKVFIRDTLDVEVWGKTTINVKNDAVLNVAGDLKAQAKNIYMEAQQDFHVKAGGSMFLQASNSMNIKSGGSMALDGSIIDFNDGKSAAAADTGLEVLSTATPTGNKPTDLDRVECTQATDERSEGDGGDDPQKQEKDVATGKKTQEEVDRGKEIAKAGCKRSDTKSAIIVPPTAYKTGEFDNYREFPMSIQLSANFKLGDILPPHIASAGQARSFFKSSIPTANGLTKSQILDNMRGLCVNVLEPVKKRFPQMSLTSVFRIGPAEAQHGMGLAADMQFGGGLAAPALYDAALWIRDNVAFDQLLLEYGTFSGVFQGWVHCSFNPQGNRPIAGKGGFPKVATFMDHKIATAGDGKLKLYLCDLSRP